MPFPHLVSEVDDENIIPLSTKPNNYMQAHLVGGNISRLRVPPLSVISRHFLSKREMTLWGNSQLNKQNLEREREKAIKIRDVGQYHKRLNRGISGVWQGK